VLSYNYPQVQKFEASFFSVAAAVGKLSEKDIECVPLMTKASKVFRSSLLCKHAEISTKTSEAVSSENFDEKGNALLRLSRCVSESKRFTMEGGPPPESHFNEIGTWLTGLEAVVDEQSLMVVKEHVQAKKMLFEQMIAMGQELDAWMTSVSATAYWDEYIVEFVRQNSDVFTRIEKFSALITVARQAMARYAWYGAQFHIQDRMCKSEKADEDMKEAQKTKWVFKLMTEYAQSDDKAHLRTFTSSATAALKQFDLSQKHLPPLLVSRMAKAMKLQTLPQSITVPAWSRSSR